MAMLEIGGVAVKDPTSFDWYLMDLSSEEGAGRTLAGKATKDIVAQKRKLSCSWSNISWSDASTILKEINKSAFFNVKYPDAMECEKKTKKFYVGDRSSKTKMWNSKGKIYASMSFDFIEQ